VKLSIVVGDVLEQPGDALVVPIDGEARADESIDRLLGNIGRQLAKRFAKHAVIDQLESQLDLPLALGHATSVPVEGLPFATLIMVSTLHHTAARDDRDKRALVVRSFASALACAHRTDTQRLVSAVLQGGWRMTATEAFSAMLTAMDASVFAGELVIATRDDATAESLRGHARSVGW
jgi:hypothetical protein